MSHLCQNLRTSHPLLFIDTVFKGWHHWENISRGGKMGGKSRLELPKLGDAQQHSLETIYATLRSQRHTNQQRISTSSMCVRLPINVVPVLTCPPHVDRKSLMLYVSDCRYTLTPSWGHSPCCPATAGRPLSSPLDTVWRCHPWLCSRPGDKEHEACKRQITRRLQFPSTGNESNPFNGNLPPSTDNRFCLINSRGEFMVSFTIKAPC